MEHVMLFFHFRLKQNIILLKLLILKDILFSLHYGQRFRFFLQEHMLVLQEQKQIKYM